MSKYRQQRKAKGGLVHYYGECMVCEKVFNSRNAIAVAARHTDATGHTTWVETGYHTRFYVGDEDEKPKGQGTVF